MVIKRRHYDNITNFKSQLRAQKIMQDFFFVGIISAIALGVVLFKSILFIMHVINLKKSNEIVEKNLAHVRAANWKVQQAQSALSSFEAVANWKVDDPRLTEDLRQQFLTKTKTRRTPTSDRASPNERVPLATTDFIEPFNDELEDSVPIYTYNPSIGGTQV